jgi:predicted RND superfamily exporter protein
VRFQAPGEFLRDRRSESTKWGTCRGAQSAQSRYKREEHCEIKRRSQRRGGIGVHDVERIELFGEPVLSKAASGQQLIVILPLTLFLIFLLLCALYSNFKFPFIAVLGVLLSAPVGGIVALWVTGVGTDPGRPYLQCIGILPR